MHEVVVSAFGKGPAMIASDQSRRLHRFDISTFLKKNPVLPRVSGKIVVGDRC
jgi:hypothetical protein